MRRAQGYEHGPSQALSYTNLATWQLILPCAILPLSHPTVFMLRKQDSAVGGAGFLYVER
jgi:hypothetical protein